MTLPIGEGTEVVEAIESGEPVEAVETPAEAIEGAETVVESLDDDGDYWSSLKEKGYDPKALEKSHTRFTQELEAVKERERELAPYMQLKDAMDADERVLAAFEKALNEPGEGEDEVDVLRREITTLKQNMATEREVESLKQYAATNDFPEVDERAVIQHAMKHNLGNLRAAYNDMNLNAIREAERKRAFDEVKGVQKAKAVTATAGTTKGTPTFTPEEIEAMSPKQFLENRAAIFASYDTHRG